MWRLFGSKRLSKDLVGAVERGDVAAVQALLAKGANVYAKDNDGSTAPSLASQNGHGEVVEVVQARARQGRRRRCGNQTASFLS